VQSDPGIDEMSYNAGLIFHLGKPRPGFKTQELNFLLRTGE